MIVGLLVDSSASMHPNRRVAIAGADKNETLAWIKPDRASGAWTRWTRERRGFYLTRASSIPGYGRDLDESIIGLLADTQRFGQHEGEEF